MLFHLLKAGWFGWYFDKEVESNGNAEDPKTDDGAGGDDAGKAGKKDPEIIFTPEQEKLIGKRLKEAREKEREKAKTEAEAEAARAKKEAEDAALVKNQEWQALAESRTEELRQLTDKNKELEPYKDQAEKYKAALDKQLALAKKNLPKHITELIDKMDPVDAMEYLTKNAEALGAKPETYSETPEGKEKKVSDDDKKSAQQASSSVIARSF